MDLGFVYRLSYTGTASPFLQLLPETYAEGTCRRESHSRSTLSDDSVRQGCPGLLLKNQESADEIVASKALADLDPVWGHGMLSSNIFVQMIYSSL